MYYRRRYNKTIEPEGPDRRPTIAAVVAASGLMLVFGLTYRVVAAKLEAPVAATPISPEALVRFPLDLGGWRGKEVPMDEKVVQRTGTDAHLNRRYVRRGGLEAVTFYLASGVKARDLMPHRPEVCYNGAGWTLVNKRSVELPLSDSARLPCNIIQFSRGVLNTQRIVVLDYYLVDDQYCGDVSLLRWKAWRGSGTVRYVAQVQISTPLLATDNAEAAIKIVSDFAIESAALTAALFDEPVTARGAGDLRESPRGQ
jgi:EpsI family protein